jgi:hypothetical protein
MKFNIQYPIYQVLEDGIREKHRFFLKDKKNLIWSEWNQNVPVRTSIELLEWAKILREMKSISVFFFN